MNRIECLAYQKSFRDFARIDHWSAPHAVTLTLRQGLMASLPGGDTFVPLTRQEASQNYRHFLNILNGRVFGKAAKRFGRRVNSISTIEGGGGGKRLHIHGIIDCSSQDLLPEFPAVVSEAWHRTQWGLKQIDIKSGADAGWTKYISKLRDKPNYADAIDWQNYENVDCWV